MKRLTAYAFILTVLTTSVFWAAKPVQAACTSVPLSGNYTVSTSCQFNMTLDGVDTTSGDNTASITVATTKSLTVTNQTIVAGSFNVSAASVAINLGTGAVLSPGVGNHIFVTDADGDGFPASSTFSTSGSIRRAGLSTSVSAYVDQYFSNTGLDCGDADPAAKPGQTAVSSGTFVNGINASLTHDWNCNGTETQTYPTATYACYVNSCTNGSGYTSSYNNANGFSGSVPACGAAGTYYTIIVSTACIDPAQASCTGYYSTSSVTQTCL